MKTGTRDAAVLAAVFATAMLFALYTRLAWDDWYITYRASKNMALGAGLTFTPGERVHSFTSPLGALVPGMLSIVVGNVHDDLVLWLFRGLNALLLGLAAVTLLHVAERHCATRWAPLLLVACCFLDAKLLANTINGMETAMLALFLALALYLMVQPRTARTTLLLGLAWSGLMWTRPDGFVDIVALCLGFLLFPPAGGGWADRFAQVRQYVLAGLVMLPVYGPWLIWAHVYYGSFVPHTIIAKGLTGPGFHLDRKVIAFLIGRTQNWPMTFMPPYAITFGGWPRLVVAASRTIAWLGALLWLVSWFRPIVRALSFAALAFQAYLTFGMEYAFPWYIPPAAVLTIAALALALDQVAGVGRGGAPSRPSRIVAGSGAGALLAATIAMTVVAAAQLRLFQRVIYDRNYRAVGAWLHDHAAGPHDTVFLEPLGYIGFFSGLKMYDYPGLSSNEMIAARRRYPVRDLGNRAIFAQLIPDMRPDWVVLRPLEIALVQEGAPGLLGGQYRQVRVFDVAGDVAAVRHLPGRPWFQLDQTFVLFQRIRGARAPT